MGCQNPTVFRASELDGWFFQETGKWPETISRVSIFWQPCVCVPMFRPSTLSRPPSADIRVSTTWCVRGDVFTSSATLFTSGSTRSRVSAVSSLTARCTVSRRLTSNASTSQTTFSLPWISSKGNACCWYRAQALTGPSPTISEWFFCQRPHSLKRPWTAFSAS